MIRQHHQLNGHEFEQTPGGGGGQRSLACCSPWGRKELDTTQQLSNNSSGIRTSIPHFMIQKLRLISSQVVKPKIRMRSSEALISLISDKMPVVLLLASLLLLLSGIQLQHFYTESQMGQVSGGFTKTKKRNKKTLLLLHAYSMKTWLYMFKTGMTLASSCVGL